MNQDKAKHWVIFRKDGYEAGPFNCESELVYDDNEHCIVHKKIVNVGKNQNDLYITYKNEGGNWEFVRGFIYKNNKEFKINSFVVLSSLQRGAFCYDGVGICEYDEK